jgi:putative transposase
MRVAMTQARQIFHGATYFLTRRVLRKKLLRPDPEITALILYSLAVAASLYEVQIHAFCAMPSHIHLVASDPDKKLPHFLRCFHHLVAMGVKRLRNLEGVVWDNARTGVLRLLTLAAIKEKIVYTLANPVIMGAVSRVKQWTGAMSRVTHLGANDWRVPRPQFYFRTHRPKWPANQDLPIHLPPGVTDAVDFRQQIAKQLVLIEEGCRNRTKQRKCKKQKKSVYSSYKLKTGNRTSSFENSVFAAGEGHQEVFETELVTSKTFRASYRDALAKWQAGDRSVAFPRGTWWMSEFHKANIAEAETTTIPSKSIETSLCNEELSGELDSDTR